MDLIPGYNSTFRAKNALENKMAKDLGYKPFDASKLSSRSPSRNVSPIKSRKPSGDSPSVFKKHEKF